MGGNPQRDQHILTIAEHGRKSGQIETGYKQRSRIEAQIGRFKSVTGGKLQAREIDRQLCEINVKTKALNQMNRLGRANYERVL